MAGRLQGKTAIITGAGSGIGRETAILFGTEGASVVCADINSTGAAATAELCRQTGSAALALAVDVASEPDTRRMAEDAFEAFGSIDVLYANAGVAGSGTAEDTERSEWDRVIGVNLTGVWLSSKHVLPRMREQGAGSIINQASIGGLSGFQSLASYSAAKGGVISLTRQMAVDFAPDNIRVNAICPGSVPTPLVVETYRQRGVDMAEARQGILARYPIRRQGTERDIANLALFLASDESTWITGSSYTIDGGYTAG
jgi:NAD(P)-dependent dehydrogenase (short-subunit alcohol dehydrogenase family)